MARGDFARLRRWAEDEGHEINVSQPGSTADGKWWVSVDLEDPVILHASSADSDIDVAAESVIRQLVTVGEAVP